MNKARQLGVWAIVGGIALEIASKALLPQGSLNLYVSAVLAAFDVVAIILIIFGVVKLIRGK
jgi:hypothetical protein